MGVTVSKPHHQTYHNYHASTSSLASSNTNNANGNNNSALQLHGSNALVRVPSGGSRLDVTSQTSITTNKSAFAFAAARRLSHLFGEIFGHHPQTHRLGAPSNNNGTSRVSSARSNSIPDISHWDDDDNDNDERNSDDLVMQWHNNRNRVNIANELLNISRLTVLDSNDDVVASAAAESRTNNNFFASRRRGSSRRGSLATTVNNSSQDDSDASLATRVCLACRRRLLYFNRKVICCNCKDIYCQEYSEKNIVGVTSALLQRQNAPQQTLCPNGNARAMINPQPAPATAATAGFANIAAARMFSQFHAYPCTSNSADGVPQQSGTAGIGMNFMCKSCISLLEPQPARATLMQLRVRNLIRYLQQLEIPTEFCTEKSDLVDILLQYKSERARGANSLRAQTNDTQPSNAPAAAAGRLYPSLFGLQPTNLSTLSQTHQRLNSPFTARRLPANPATASSPFATLESNISGPLRRVVSNPPVTLEVDGAAVSINSNNNNVAAPNSWYSLFSNNARPQVTPAVQSTSLSVTPSSSTQPIRRRSQFKLQHSDSEEPRAAAAAATAANSTSPFVGRPTPVIPNYASLWRTASEQQLSTTQRSQPHRLVLPSVAIAPPPADSEEDVDEGVVNDDEAAAAASTPVGQPSQQPRNGNNVAQLFATNKPQVFKDTLDAFMALETEHAALAAIRQLSVRQLKTALAKNLVTITGIYEKEELCQRMLVLWRTKRREKLINVDDETDENVCKICMDAPCNAVLLNCGHMLACVECSRHLAECPACRALVINVVRVFRM